MAKPELTDDDNAHLRQEMLAAIDAKTIPRVDSINKLAMRLEINGGSLSQFLNKRGGASRETARKFATLVGRTYEDVLGHGPAKKPAVATTTTAGGYRATPRAAKIAREYLKQGPHPFTDLAIDYAEEETRLESRADSDNPSRVAEAFRKTILGQMPAAPLHPNPAGVVVPMVPSSPPAKKPHSRIRGRETR